MKLVGSLDRRFRVVIQRVNDERVRNPDGLDHQNAVVFVDVAFDLARESVVSCRDPARLQRATKGPR